ncbi:hypothetical protein CLFE_043780 [Clostridium felsineum DSM 794]|nr:hypothetical protein CLFE_043780 [Clostridium felsineum DSM 794]
MAHKKECGNMKKKFIAGIIAVVIVAVGGYMYVNSNKSNDKSENKVASSKKSKPKKAEKKVSDNSTANNTAQSANENSSSNTSTNNNSSSAKTNPNPQDTTKAVREKSQEEIYMGTWVIKKDLAYAPASTYSKEDINKLIGKKLVFSADSATCFGDSISDMDKTVKTPMYEKTSVLKSDFEQNNKVTLDKLGLSGSTVTQVQVQDASGNGCVFYIKDSKTMILSGGGVYFEIDKQ